VHTTRILCAFDFTRESRIALQMAITYTLELNATLRVVHVLRPDTYSAVPGDHEPTNVGTSHKKKPRRVSARCEQITSSVAVGDTADEIARIAGEIDADLIMMGIRPTTGWERVRDGYIPDEVASVAPCPVVVLEIDVRERTDLPRSPSPQICLN
jgi:nucleotide-binding universal stress UspA family protein